MNKLVVLFILIVFSVSSCKTLPFIGTKKSNSERALKREERLKKRKKKAQYKVDVNKGKKSRKIKKLEKLERKLPQDTIVVGLDSASLAKDKAEIANIPILKQQQIEARKIIAVNQIKFNTVKLKTKMKYSGGGKKYSFVAHFRIEHDKKIWVNITMPGFYVARALLTPTRVKAINRINKEYYDYSFEEIKRLINVDIDFYTLQDIIIGNALGNKGEVFELGNFGGTINIGIKGKEFLNKLTYNKSDSTLRQMQLQVFRGSYASNILGMLGEYQKSNQRFIATKRIYNIEDSKGKLNLEMEIQKVEFDKEVRMPYTIPKNYKKVE